MAWLISSSRKRFRKTRRIRSGALVDNAGARPLLVRPQSVWDRYIHSSVVFLIHFSSSVFSGIFTTFVPILLTGKTLMIDTRPLSMCRQEPSIARDQLYHRPRCAQLRHQLRSWRGRQAPRCRFEGRFLRGTWEVGPGVSQATE